MANEKKARLADMSGENVFALNEEKAKADALGNRWQYLTIELNELQKEIDAAKDSPDARKLAYLAAIELRKFSEKYMKTCEDLEMHQNIGVE